MVRARRPRSASLTIRLLALVVVPSAALSLLAMQRADSEREHAEAAHHVVETAEVQQAVAAISPYAALERIALEGLARLDELGAPRAFVVALSGFDLETTYTENVPEFERRLDRLEAVVSELSSEDGAPILGRLRAVRADLVEQRELSGQRLARSDEVARVFDDLDGVLGAALDVAHGHDHDTIPTALMSRSSELAALRRVLTHASGHGQLAVQSILYPSDDLYREVDRAAVRHELAFDELALLLDEADRAELEVLRDRIPDSPTNPPPTSDPAAPTSFDPETVATSADQVLTHIAYLHALESFSQELHAEVLEEVEVAARAAGSKATRTQVYLVATILVTGALVALVAWTIIIPIRRLRERAAAISRGELDLDPLPLRGPSDVRDLSSTMNDLLATLKGVNHEMTLLAAGEVDTAAHLELPGAIGVATRESVMRLASVTDRLQRSERLAAAIIDQAADAIWTLDGHGAIRSANDASEALTGATADEQIGRAIGEFLSSTRGEASVLRPDGPDATVLVASSSIALADETITIIIAHDISERARFEERLTYQALHDALTGLPNRFAVLEHLQGLAEDQIEAAVLFVDLDAFKSVNDTHGHAVGDQVITEISAAIARSIRTGDFLGRLGGDEFVIVTDRFDHLTDVLALGHRVIREIEQPLRSGDQVFVISASVGVAAPPAGTAATEALRQADNAVYQAKARGKGRVEVFDAEMQARIDRAAEIELELRNAIRRDELVVHLQPVMDLDTGEFNGAEALVRWDRPGSGMIPPGEFIPIAERSNLIFDVERWVLSEVCGRLAEWRRRDPDSRLTIAVNISGRHLIEGDLLHDVDAALAATHADPTMLELELTETHLLEDLDRATTVLDELRRRGISIAVDDFGTGYSSMTYLRHLPIDTLKIDRSFVARATEHGYDSTVIDAVLTIGRTLELSVVAEGVETDEQLEYVRARGCHRAQGFLLARPVPVDEAERMVFGAAARG